MELDKVHQSTVESGSEIPEPIAIVGMAGRFPKADNVQQFWENVRNAEDCISRLTQEEILGQGVNSAVVTNPNYVLAAPVLRDVDKFDPTFFGITPREAELMDPQQRIFLECCWEALEDAGHPPKRGAQTTGVFAGARTDTYLFNILTHPNLVEAVGAFHIGLGNDLAFLTTRVSHLLDLTGPSVSVHTACSTSLVAVHLACEALRKRHCDAALAGGVAVNVPHNVGYLYEEGSVQSPDGHCRTFDASARGTVFGSGAGVVLLKRLSDAVADHDSIYALIRGSAINNDGSDKASFTAPSVQGQVNVISEALRVSKVDPDTISYVECHGTGTLLGDAIEIRALVKAHGKETRSSCAIGSVKTNVGHLDAAAGMTSLIKTALSLKHRTIPASLHYIKPNPQINFEGTRFYVNTSTSPWVDRESPRRAGVSAFGVGGTNAHVILEEAEPDPASQDGSDLQVLPISARSKGALVDSLQRVSKHLHENRSLLSLSDVAFTLQEGRLPFEYRHVCVCGTTEEAVSDLSLNCPSAESFLPSNDVPPEITFLFPGQGSQYVGMGTELYQKEPVFRKHLRECSDLLKPWLERDLVSLLYDSSSPGSLTEMDLAQTWIAQPAIVAVEYALAHLWMSWGVRPNAMLGHSVGEYTAAVLSGVMAIEDALHLVAVRGRLMQQTTPGRMLAVSLGEADIASLLFGGLSVAAFNAPDLCTIAGSPDEIETIEAELNARGIACQLLRTSHAFHTESVEPAMGRYIEEINKIGLSRPNIPFISCVTGRWITPEEAQRPEYWANQMRLPVQFDTGMNHILTTGDPVLLDVGPGQTLRRLALRRKTSLSSLRVIGAMPTSNGSGEWRSLLRSLGELWVAGVPVNWGAVRRGQGRRVSLPTYPFQRSRFWVSPATKQHRDDVGLEQAAGARMGRKVPDISQWFWIPTSKLSPLVSTASAGRGGCLVYCDEGGLGERVCLSLEARGEKVIRVVGGDGFHRVTNSVYEIDVCSRQQHAKLWDSLSQSETEIATVVSINIDQDRTLDAKSSHPDFRFPSLITQNLFGLQAMLDRPADPPRKYVVVSTDLLDIERLDELEPAKTSIVGLMKALKDEHQDFAYRVIDIAKSDSQKELIQTAKQISEEILSDATDEVIAYRGNKRWARDFMRVPMPRDYSNESIEGGVYLILGGLGTVGLSVAEYLVKTAHIGALVLTGRTPLPPRDEWSAIISAGQNTLLAHRIRSVLQMEKDGATVETIDIDITDPTQLREAVSSIESRYGQVHGIIHAAGVTGGQSAFCIGRKLELEHFSEQWKAKLLGLSVLADAIRDREVPLVLLISSNSSIVGGLGFAAYAAASCSMNAFAEARTKEQQRTRWLSVSWDHWPEIKLGGAPLNLDDVYGDLSEADVTRALELKYRYAMSKEEVTTALSYVFEFPGSGHLIVSTGDLTERLASSSAPLPTDVGYADQGNSDSSQTRAPRPKLQNVLVKPRNELEATLAAIWEDFLGMEEIGVHDDFFELGGHSLLATKLVAHVRSVLGSELPLAKLFEGPTIAQMAEHLLVSSEAVSR